MNGPNYYVLVDTEKLGRSVDTPRIFSSIPELSKQKIIDNGKILTYDALKNRLSRDNELGYWKNERYIIKKCPVERSKRK